MFVIVQAVQIAMRCFGKMSLESPNCQLSKSEESTKIRAKVKKLGLTKSDTLMKNFLSCCSGCDMSIEDEDKFGGRFQTEKTERRKWLKNIEFQAILNELYIQTSWKGGLHCLHPGKPSL